jgi:catechol 2,3-dioxygenase-like lactoylglutathione lyase family enzyme
MQTQRLSTCLTVRDLAASVAFYRDHLGFVVAYQLPWFATLLRPVQSEPVWDLSLIRVGHEVIPERIRHTPTSGLILGVVVEDARAELQRLQEADVPIVQELVDEPYGQRHFFCADPDGVLIDVIQTIPPDPEWLKAHAPS